MWLTQHIVFRKFFPIGLLFLSSIESQAFQKDFTQAQEHFKKSQVSQSNRNQQAFLKRQARSFTKQNYFNISSTASQGTLNEIEGITSRRRTDNQTINFGVSFTEWNGLSAEASTTRNNEVYQEVTGVDPDNAFYTNSFTLSYELLQQGERGITRSQAFANYHQSNANLYNTKANYINLRREFENHFIDHYFNLCKETELKKAKAENDKALRKARAAKQAGTMSLADFLNIEVSKNQIILQLQQIQNELQVSLRSAEKWQKNYVDFLTSLSGKECQAVKTISPTFDKTKIAKNFPSVRSAQEILSQSQKEIYQVDSTYKPSVKPFLRLNQGVESITENENEELVIGLEAKWIIPSSKSALDKRASLIKRAFAKREKQAQEFSTLATIAQLLTSINTNNQLIAVYETNLATFEKLLRTLKAKISIGKADSISYSTNYANFITAVLSKLDLQASNLKSISYLKNIEENSR